MLLHEHVTREIIGAFFEVHDELGWGFLESVYEGAMVVALQQRGLKAETQRPISVHFRGVVVGTFWSDLLVEQKVIVELKAGRSLAPAHEAQLIHYLKATRMEVGLLFHFGTTPTFRRRVLTHHGNAPTALRVHPRDSAAENALGQRIVAKTCAAAVVPTQPSSQSSAATASPGEPGDTSR